ncbi:hypothetical protein FACS1894189_2450 [Planctomycetales bacterium]|nr:hypothetical protein FACS1894189_2450 [Planctomycetales bacterium]
MGIFRPALSVLRKPQPKGGRPYFDIVLMFKIIVLKSQYNLSDDMTEFFIRDRKTFQNFLGITPYRTIPDAKHRFCESKVLLYLTLRKLGRVM